MDNDGTFARLGISSTLGYGLILQNILLIIVSIISIWGMFKLKPDFSLRYITNIVSLLVCISLLVYSTYGFNAKKHQEVFFMNAVILFIVLVAFGLFTDVTTLKNPAGTVTVITLVSAIYFLHEYRRNYKVANFAMMVVLISGIISIIFNMMGGMPWFIALKYIIIPIAIGLTYFERVKRNKYDLDN